MRVRKPASVQLVQKKTRGGLPEDFDLLEFAKKIVSAHQTENDFVDEDEIEDEEEYTPPVATSKNTSIVPRASSVVTPSQPKPEKKESGYADMPWYDPSLSDTDAEIIYLYGKGMSMSDIVSLMKKSHGMDLHVNNISGIIEKIYPLVKDWQARPLSSCYPILYLDAMQFRVKEEGKSGSKVAYIALGFNIDGQKDVLGIWVAQTEGAKFWIHVLQELKDRGVQDILITCVDGLPGFPEAIRAVFPRSEVQVCIVHMIRKTLMRVAHKDRERFAAELKYVYTASNDESALECLDQMEKDWPQYAVFLKNWRNNWTNLTPFFNYPASVRQMIYTTNIIESLNSQFRRATKTKPGFANDSALIKLLWLIQADISSKWRVTARNWGTIIGELSYLFPERLKF